ncbi:MAG: MFS transporter [Holophagales bacterium]|nr:MFS transporter [Holophagales bacterium]
MRGLRAVFSDYVEAARAFSQPARLLVVSVFLVWVARGIQGVLFNLYLVEAGHQAPFVGRALAMTGAGIALAALPAGLFAERWGRRRCLMLGLAAEGIGLLLRALVTDPGAILALSFLGGAGQSLYQIAALPFLTEHSGSRERTHLFSVVFSAALLAGVVGSAVGGFLPAALLSLPDAVRPGSLGAYRGVLVLGGLVAFSASLPLLRLRGLQEASAEQQRAVQPPGSGRLLVPIAFNFLLVGCGAGLVVPFMNLYFKDRFACSAAQIGAYFSIASIVTAVAGLAAPLVARRFGTLRTAVAFELLSLPFLVTMGAESRLAVAVGAFWLRAMLMQAGTPLLQTFVMEALPPGLRARSSSVNNLVWNLGWAASAGGAGALIARWGYALPFYLTAALYATASITFYLSFRRFPRGGGEPRIGEVAMSLGAQEVH